MSIINEFHILNYHCVPGRGRYVVVPIGCDWQWERRLKKRVGKHRPKRITVWPSRKAEANQEKGHAE